MKGETGGTRCRGFKAEPEEEEEEGRGWSQAGNRKYNWAGCADAAKVGILHFGVLLPPTCSSSVSHLYHASQVKML